MTDSNLPYSDQYRVAAERWVSLDSAATMLEECKSSVLAQSMVQQGDVPVTHAERTVKASPEWKDFVTKMVKAREAANLAKVHLEFIKMKAWEANSENATKRAEMRMLGDTP